MALLWTGLAFSAIGDQAYLIALSWISAAAFGAWAGWLVALGPASVLITVLLAGRFADTLAPLPAMMAADAARAAILLIAVAAWSTSGAPPVPALIAAIIVLGAAQAVFRPALQVVIPAVVPDPASLPAANALLDATERIARLAGPALAGLIASVVPLQHLLTLDAATFMLSGLALLAIHRRRPVVRVGAQFRARVGTQFGAQSSARPVAPGTISVLQAMLHGVHVSRRHPVMGWVLGFTGVLNGAWYVALFLALPLMLAADGSGLASFGLVISAYGCTNLAANLYLGSRAMTPRPARQIGWGNFVLGFGLLAMAAAHALPAEWRLAGYMLAAAVAAPGGPMQDIPVAVLRQTAFAPADVPAVMRAYLGVNQAGLLAGMAAAPLLLGTFSPAVVIAVCASIVLGVGLKGIGRFRDEAAQ